jgi:small subunit ribosomal protein S4
MPALRFKTCRLLLGNVWNREVSLIQRRILRRLRNRKRSIQRNLSQGENLNSNIKLQTTRKLSLYYGDLPIREMHKGRERTSYIPFLLNQETRLDVILVRLRFCDTLPQARQLISHRRVCLNNGLVTMTHLKVSQGDLISFQENDARTREIRRSFYKDILVGQIIGKFLPVKIRLRTKTEWFRLLTTQVGCNLLVKSGFLQELRSSMQEEDLERTKKFGSAKVCLGSSFAEHKRMRRNLFHFKYGFLGKRADRVWYERAD